MNVIPEARRPHYIWYLRFNDIRTLLKKNMLLISIGQFHVYHKIRSTIELNPSCMSLLISPSNKQIVSTRIDCLG
jgi:hypothetical protein